MSISQPRERDSVYADLGGGLYSLMKGGRLAPPVKAPPDSPSFPLQPQPDVYVPLSDEQITLNERGLLAARAVLASLKRPAGVGPNPHPPEQLALPLIPKRG